MSNLREQFETAIGTASHRISESREWDNPFVCEPTVMDTLLDQLEAIARERMRDHLDTVLACLQAAGGSEDLDELERQCNEAGPKPSYFVRKQFEELQKQRDKAWQIALSLQDILNDRTRALDAVVEAYREDLEDE